jgi:hypothetical protein
MTELQPLYDTAGAGLSLLDTILHTRVNLDGVVSRTVSRVVYVCKYSSTASPADLCEQQAQLLSDSDPEATGLLVIQPKSFWGILESSPETVAALMRWMAAEMSPTASAAAGRPEPRVKSCRIVCQIEDCPTRGFGPWSYRSMVLPPSADTVAFDPENASPVQFSASVYQSIMQVGKACLEGGPGVLDLLSERFSSFLPSDDRVCALADWPKVSHYYFAFQRA